MIPLAFLFSVTVIYMQDKSANLLSIGAVDFGIIVDSSTIIVENIYRHVTAPNADRIAAADRPDHRRVVARSSGAFSIPPHHHRRLHSAVLDDRPGGACSVRWRTHTPSRSQAPCSCR